MTVQQVTGRRPFARLFVQTLPNEIPKLRGKFRAREGRWFPFLARGAKLPVASCVFVRPPSQSTRHERQTHPPNIRGIPVLPTTNSLRRHVSEGPDKSI